MNNSGQKDFLTDEAFERLIAEVEAEPLLHPPGEFKNDIIRQIRLEKERKKKVKLFSYSLKVFAAAAAALMIVFIVPESVRPEENIRYVNTEQERESESEMDYQEGFGWTFNRRLDEYCSRINSRLNQLVGMEVSIYEKEEE